MPELTIVVPTYNEKDNIELIYQALKQALKNIEWELVIVDDDSPDGTAEVTRRLSQADQRVRSIQRIWRRGLSSACVEGMLASSSPYLAVMDADLQHDETLLPTMLERLKTSDDDLVIASRYTSGGSANVLSPNRAFVSRLACKLSSLVLQTELSDPMSGYFMLRRPFLEQTVRRLYGKGFKILLDLVASSQGDVRIYELPYTMRERRHGKSKLGLQVSAEYLILLSYKLFGRLIPARFFLFTIVGLSGVGVHLTVLALAFQIYSTGFVTAQVLATMVAMTSNFFLNNLITYRDKRLHGWALFRGLGSFYFACGIGAVLSVAVGDFLFERSLPYLLAGFTGAIVAAVWNFMLTSVYTWGDSTGARKYIKNSSKSSLK